MRNVYPAIFTPVKEGGYAVYIPDFDINTQGDDLAHAIEMARDAIGLMGIDMEDEHKPVPTPAAAATPRQPEDIVSLVDIDFAAYRRENETRAVRKNVSLPAWMANKADQEGLNCSQLLQEAIRQKLGLT